jgi:hypothetical protein
VSPEREPLGVLDAWMWAREFKDADGQRGGAPESLRWKEGYERVAELAAELPDTRLVYVGDREADSVEWMARARDLGTPADWLVRAKHNRTLPQTAGQKLWATVLASAPLGEVGFPLPRGRGRRTRPVHQELFAQRVSMADGRGGTLAVTCLIAREVGAPPASRPSNGACSPIGRSKRWRPPSN